MRRNFLRDQMCLGSNVFSTVSQMDEGRDLRCGEAVASCEEGQKAVAR